MQISTTDYSSFPDQVVPESVKNSMDYGMQVAQAIEGQWFRNYRGGLGASYRNGGYAVNFNTYHTLRLYSRGEQPVQKYKDELAINGDLSYLNLDWKPVPIIPKFLDIVVNGMTQKLYDVKAVACDPESTNKRTEYAQQLIVDIQEREMLKQMEQMLGIKLESDAQKRLALESPDELELHLQLDYKQSVEIAEEELIKNILEKNKFELTQRRFVKDLVTIGIGAVKTNWNEAEGITIDYVDPANMVYSYTDDPNFEDIYYVGEVKNVSLQDLKKQFPYLTDEEMETIQKYRGNSEYLRNWNGWYDQENVQVLYFEYKTYVDQVFKIKETPNGLEKALEKPDTFNPPEADNFKRISRSIEVLYKGAKILGHPLMLEWRKATNMTRPLADTTRVRMNYIICAPKLYKGRINSLVERMTSFADMIQLTHLKLQQVLARIVPDGVYVDMDGLAEVDLGNGTNYNPAEALNMYFQTGSIVGRSMTQDGEFNHGKVPIQELQSSNGMAKIQSLISTYQYYLQMIRDVTGLNEARDGSNPDKDALVGLQKLAAAQSNVATRHLLQAMLYIISRTCENITLRVADSLQFPTTRQSLQDSLSRYNTASLEELIDLNLHDFGIYLQVEPDEEEKQYLEQNIQIALQSQQINLEDAIDLREINNIKLANQMLAQRRAKKEKKDQQRQQQMIQAQAQANAESQEKAALAEVQKQQAIAQTTLQIEKGKSDLEIQRMQTDMQLKSQLAQQKFEFDKQLKQMDMSAMSQKEAMIEDRKDQRVREEGTQQSLMMNQREFKTPPIDFNTSKGEEQSSTMPL